MVYCIKLKAATAGLVNHEDPPPFKVSTPMNRATKFARIYIFRAHFSPCLMSSMEVVIPPIDNT